jgi:two-component system, response regulator PdtaR
MRIIIAEDDALLALCIEGAVEDAGHTVGCCEASSRRALQCAREHGADLAVLDISLNEGPTAGVALANQLKTELNIPSIFASGQRQDAASAHDIALGFLSKPYSPEDVVAAISVAEALIRGVRPPPPQIPRAMELFG